MTKDIFFFFEPGTTKLHEGEVALNPLQDDPEYSDGIPYTEVVCKGGDKNPIYFTREHWKDESWFVVKVARGGLDRIVCKVNDSLDPQPTDEEVARALLEEVYADRTT
ncbi:MAG: hypothetical protein AAB395_03560 [Patescibacteria group bacterium]